MEYSVGVKVATITLWNFAAIIVNIIAFMILYMKANRNISLKAFFLVQFSMIIWLIGKVFKTVSPTVELRWGFIVLYYFGICLLGASFLDFAYIYNKGRPLKKGIRIGIYIVALIQFIIVLTNPYHYLFYRVYHFWGDDFGKLFYFFIGITYSFTFIGMVLCGNKFKKQIKDKSRIEKSIIYIAILLPLVFNYIYITRILGSLFDIIGIQIFDITPIVYTWSILIFIYATFKYEFFDLTPLMKHEVTKRLDTPIVIMNQDSVIIYANEKAKEIFLDLQVVVKYFTKNIASQGEKILQYENKYYRYAISNYQSIGGTKFIISFHDITSLHMISAEMEKENNELNNANKKLKEQIENLKQTSHISARNYVARELHDIIGHSLVITMKLLEVAKISLEKNRDKTIESFEKAKFSVKNGFDEMKQLKNKPTIIVCTSAILEREIKSMLKTVEISGVKTNFYFRGKQDNIDEIVFDIIKKISTELVTNTLKHANATSLLLSITFDGEQVMIQLMDNGTGFKSLMKGNGLTGIDSRLDLVSGKARYSSELGEGFAANITIPLP